MNDLEIAANFAGLHGLDGDMLDTTRISPDALRDWVRDRRDELLSLDLRQEGALRKFRRPDYIALVSEMRSDRMEPAFYLAVESSYSVREKDIDKATDNAKILRAVTGREAYRWWLPGFWIRCCLTGRGCGSMRTWPDTWQRTPRTALSGTGLILRRIDAPCGLAVIATSQAAL